jgi:nitroreductase/NAD-dependent dihydropyrimidine dehydrogenase PreA subunit
MDPATKELVYGRRIEPPTVDVARCTGCGSCVKECPAHLFEVRDKKSTVVAGESCIGCGHCWAVCPERAVDQQGSSAPEEADFPEEPVVSAEEIATFLGQRRSVRRFKSQPIERELLERVARAARHAPTGSNRQNVGIIVVPTAKQVAELRELTEQFMLGMFKKLQNPIVAKLVAWKTGPRTIPYMKGFADRLRWLMSIDRKSPYFALPFGSAVLVAHADSDDASGATNAVLALHTASLMAQAEGLGACYLGFVAAGAAMDKRIKAWLRVPKGQTCSAAIVLGYPETKYLRPVGRLGPTVTWV